jgi:outer membrane protein assembly factor BamD
MIRTTMSLTTTRRLFIAASLLLIPACGGKKPADDPSSARQADQMLNQRGQTALEEEHWQEARDYFQQLLDTYPRSQLAGDARLGIADTYFHGSGPGNIVMAIAEYRDFLTFFPNHPRADYAQYQVALGYFQQAKSSDRDQEPTRAALGEVERLIELYRNSLYAEEGRNLLEQCHERLADHEFRVGSFYLKSRKACRGAIARFKIVLEEYPTYSKVDEVFFHLGEAYQLCRSPMEAMPYYQQVIDNFPDSALLEKAQERLEELKKQAPPAGTP